MKTQEHAAHENILVPGPLEIHAHRDIGERRDGPVDLRPAGEWLVDARQHSQQRRLAGAVVADEAEAVAVGERQTDIAKRHDRDVAAALVGLDQPSDSPPEQLAGERAPARIVDGKFDGHLVQFDARHAFTTSRECARGIARRTGA